MVFTGVFTIFLTFIEGHTYDFQQVLPPFVIATSCFIFTLNLVYQEFNTGSNKLIGDTYYSEEKYKEACDRYNKIEKHVNNRFYKTIFPPSDTFLSNLYMAYGDSKFRLSEKEEALTLLNKSLEYAERGRLTSYQWQIHYKIGQIKEEEGKLEEAYNDYKKSIDIIEDLRGLVKIAERREAFFENKADVYVKMVFLCLRLGKDEEAFNYAERAKGRVFLELLGTEKVKVKARPELKEEEKKLLRKIRAIEAKLREGRGAGERYIRELGEVMEEYDSLLLKIKEDDPEYYSLRKVDPLTINEVQGFLKENEVLLEFFVGERPVAFIIHKDSFSVVEIPMDKEELVDKTSELRARIKMITGVKRVSNEIYNGLIKPLEPMLNGKELIIVPHGILHYLPFNALHDGKEWFVEKYKARFMQNASMLRFLREKGKAKIETAFVVGNPTKDLEFAEIEAKKVADKFNVKPLLRDEARKEVVVEGSKGKDILHFSCHGMFEAGFPRFSRLMLADDNLLVAEVYNLDLNADVVTLSACETGLGGLTNGDEIEGLTRAFMRAGTPSVIASLWSVDDESTSELFLRYYDGRGDKVERLRKAQIETMKEYAHPFYWAGFVMFGEG
ncbi:MAG TPA: CHAT domain-containing protein [Archaeoglobus sp.]|nr:CHAT domain-containing protein [Archaeoglobus sp.]